MLRWIGVLRCLGTRGLFFPGENAFFRRNLTKKSCGEEKFIKKMEVQEKEAYKGLPEWQKRDISLKKRYGHWEPTKKLSRQQIGDIRDLKAQMPGLKTVELANHFGVSPEAIRRILKSTWVPNEAEEERLLRRAEKKKQQALENKQQVVAEIGVQRQRLGFASSVALKDVGVDVMDSNATGLNSGSSKPRVAPYASAGKYKHKHGFGHHNGNYNGHQKRLGKPSDNRKKPYVQTVGDFID